MRLPALPPALELSNELTDEDGSPTRGLQVLNGILEKRSRNDRKGFGRGRSGRIWLTATIVVGISCAAYIFRFAQVAPSPEISAEADLFADDEFESEPALQPGPHDAEPVRNPADAKQAVGGPATDSSVQAAVYETSQPVRARATWFDGTIDSDDSTEN